MFKVIKTEAEYEAALSAVEALIESDPGPGTREADQLEVLTVLIEDFESKTAPIDLPDPIAAIRFRMDQEDLLQKDLIPFFGSASKVSEVLSGKRPLTLTMIRALHEGLGIPAHVLLQERGEEQRAIIKKAEACDDVDFALFPLAEMARRGWIAGGKRATELRSQADQLVGQFLRPIGGLQAVPVLFRRTRHVRGAQQDHYALVAWIAQVLRAAKENPPAAPYVRGSVTDEFLREVARLSWSEQGPRLAVEFLDKHGIKVVVEPHLPRTHLDGAAVLFNVERPVIGLTLRHDRLDNFWFCLLHELAHVALHLEPGTEDGSTQFFDDLDAAAKDPLEQEADTLAGEALIPHEEWKRSPASMLRNEMAAKHLANKLRIHPAIVAGRIRHEYDDYGVLSKLVGHGQVRALFPEVEWTKS